MSGCRGIIQAQTDIIMQNNCLSSKLQGDSSESAAIFYYTMKGYVVSKPISHSSRYDIIVDDGKSISRVECKSSRCKGNQKSYQVSLVTNGGNQSGNRQVKRICGEKTDIVFIMDGDGNVYEIPASEVSGRKTVNVNNEIPWYRGNMAIGMSGQPRSVA